MVKEEAGGCILTIRRLVEICSSTEKYSNTLEYFLATQLTLTKVNKVMKHLLLSIISQRNAFVDNNSEKSAVVLMIDFCPTKCCSLKTVGRRVIPLLHCSALFIGIRDVVAIFNGSSFIQKGIHVVDCYYYTIPHIYQARPQWEF